MSGVVTRFAPSPTGHLHIGGARTALFCWAFARRHAGRFMIRIEDTDQARSSDESARGILEDLAWLGIEWDDGPVLTLPPSADAARAPGRTAPDPAPAGGVRTIGAHARPVGPYFQARRRGIYDRYIEQLVRAGRAYPAFEAPEDLDAARRAAVEARQTYRYRRPGDVRAGEFAQARWRRAQAGEPHVVRFLAPDGAVIVHDEVLGDVTYAAGEMDDFVIRKADLFPTYHFAVVVDDELMGVTHVLRAQEHLNNTPRHVALQHALVIHPADAAEGRPAGAPFRTPVYAHMPLIFNMDGSKMSKRDKAKAARNELTRRMQQDPSLTAAALAARLGLDPAAVAGFLNRESDALDVAEALARHLRIDLPEIEVADFRERGYLPEAIVNFLALLGWNPGLKTPDGKDLEKFDMAFLADHFSLDRIGRTNARFDRKKLLSFNADAIQALPDESFARRWLHWIEHEREPEHRGTPARVRDVLRGIDTGDARAIWLARAVKPRARTLADALRACDFLVRPDDSAQFDAAAVEKHLLAGGRAGLALLRGFRAALAAIPDAAWTPESIHAAMESLARAAGLVGEKGPNIGPVAQAARVAVAGVATTPPLGESLAVLGRASTLARLDRCLSEHA